MLQSVHGPVQLTDALAAPPPALQAPHKELKRRLKTLGKRMEKLQHALYAEGKRSLLVVLQARDAGGKDGTIRRVFGRLNPAGCRVTSFKAPSALERSHDYLWRIHQAVPPRGWIGVFNRSHYEDVLVVRVDELVPASVWRGRFEEINAFEKHLVGNDVTILKFFLHISKEEQRKRLEARLADPDKNWKFDEGDLAKRGQWDDYTEAYEEMLLRCSSEHAPWFVVPADEKDVRNVLVAEKVVETLERMDPRFPEAEPGVLKWRGKIV